MLNIGADWWKHHFHEEITWLLPMHARVLGAVERGS